MDLCEHLPFRVAVVSNLLALNRDWRIRDICELDPKEMRVLINIGSYMPIKSADIAYQSRMDSYSVSRAVKKLFEAKLIDTQNDEHKKNVKNLVLTAEGQKLYLGLTRAIDERNKELKSVVNESELALLFDILERLESKSEELLAQQAMQLIDAGHKAPADQKELIRWYKKSNRPIKG